MKINLHFHNKFFSNKEIESIARYFDITYLGIVNGNKEFNLKRGYANIMEQYSSSSGYFIQIDRMFKQSVVYPVIDGKEEINWELDAINIIPDRTTNFEALCLEADKRSKYVLAGTEVNRMGQPLFLDLDEKRFNKVRDILIKGARWAVE